MNFEIFGVHNLLITLSEDGFLCCFSEDGELVTVEKLPSEIGCIYNGFIYDPKSGILIVASTNLEHTDRSEITLTMLKFSYEDKYFSKREQYTVNNLGKLKSENIKNDIKMKTIPLNEHKTVVFMLVLGS